MLEVFVLAACLNHNDIACERAGTAYYYQMELDTVSKFMEEKYRDYFLIVNVAAVIKEQKLVIPMSQNLSAHIEPIQNKFEIRYKF